MDRWRGKTAVVTGAASGIGAGITRALLRNGVNVVGLDIQDELIAEMRREMNREEIEGRLHLMHCDVTREEDTDKAFTWIEQNMNGVDIMVNNAGITIYSKVIESDRKAFERLLNINVLAVAVCISRAVRSMRARNVEGHVFNVNSVLGHEIPERFLSDVEGANGWNLYPASKHATVALTRSVHRELGAVDSRIRITSISPGMVRTGISDHCSALNDLFDKVPYIEPADIADALIFALGRRPDVQISEITVEHRKTV